MKTEAIMEDKGMDAVPPRRWGMKGTQDAHETVQGELSLEKVKPVRNDLSGSDLELKNVQPADRETNSTKIDSVEVPIVKAQPLLARVLALFQRRN